MKKRWVLPLAGALSGLVNGLFGGGGGMVLLPLLSRFGDLQERELYASCLGILFPVSLVSAALYLLRGSSSLPVALPYLLGGALGGFFGGKLYQKVSLKWLKGLFSLFLLYAGVKYLL